MTAYYNEIDPFAATWLRELIAAGHIAPGEVDERSIADVRPNELAGFTQCHFFAGIGVWSHALRRAGWPDERPVWTGSCPCQPFSAAGQRGGFDDERHLWPAFHWLIDQCRPPVVMGEQVASKDGLAWFDLVSSDLEGTGYAVAANDLCAAGVGAPHIRQRLWFGAVRLADAHCRQQQGVAILRGSERERRDARWQEGSRSAAARGYDGRLADIAIGRRGEERPDDRRIASGDRAEGFAAGSCASSGDMRPGPTNGLWRDADWLFCRDGKWRPVEPGTFPLADGAPARVGRLRGYGNAINAEAARIEIETFAEAIAYLAPANDNAPQSRSEAA